ncbi:ubiquitin carboxyl-terminal hydrolase 25 isoform X2 [Eucyclogobius newberryi]|uniref:ubiquitin carboxyl-terminal hydrolase 25 isoform X2 n=1 Tax=Eucyclogobius newberryi TaxID=166745 RepID=UPI003B5C1DBF
MTVEQNVLQQHSQKHQQTLLNQLREVTGTTDVQLLQQALQVSNGDLAEAVAFLTEKNAKVPQQQDETTYYQTSQVASDRYISVGSQADTNVIDLTGDDKDDLQRAIALSLEESNRAFRETGITDEEQAISRVLEASIAENKASLKRTHTEVWSDSPNPHDRKRIDNCPVGLKNVGNTCWFSAVIQSLFNLLEFQRLVLHYSPPARFQELPRNQKEHRNLPFMQELRNLFSLMVGSKRKYVDPSRAVEILKDAFKSSELQQDVSEFTHKLLDWLEDAFQMKAEEDREGEKPKNPMVELFYGRFLAVGVLEGKKFENTEMFGQYPLQVNGFKDLHECLEAAMIEGEIESLHSAENSARSGQEHWFTELPPVLTFELSRFEFNQALGRPEKIHNKLEFPSMLYMDRYMDRNREITRIKREEIRRLKEHLTLLQQRLERYLSYGSGPKRFPLADVLQYAMEFASSKPVCTSPVDDLDSSAAPGGATGQQLPPPSTTEQDSVAPLDGMCPAASTASTAAQQQRVPIHKPFTQSRLPPDLPMHPAPRHITEEELRVLEGCLHRWRSEVENDSRDLQGSITRIHRTIELMYSDKSMMQVPYRLHAVLVHEGQANAGHYWAYIYDPHQRCWMKYNDISVTKSSWEELVRDSFGGYRNASAYCLMYINDKKPFLIEEEFDKETGQVLSGLDKLPPDLKLYVKEDNELFDKEIMEWAALQARKAQQEKLALATAAAAAAAAASAASSTSTSSSSPQPMSIESSTPDNAVPQQDPEYMEQPSPTNDSKHLQEDTERAISKAVAEQEERSPEALLNASPHSPSSLQPEASPPLALSPDLVKEDQCPGQRTVEVAIPHVGTFVIEAEEGGYDDEAMMTPNMQGIIMAIGKSSNVYEKSGPEAAFFKAIKLEYARLLRFAQEDTSPENDYRIQHIIVYFIQNQAPKKILERTLLTQFADRNLAFDERCKSIMSVARAKLDLIKPEEVNMDEYEIWHQDYRNFRETTTLMTIGLELFQKTNFVEALMYLIYAHLYNKELLTKGQYRGHDEELLGHYRRECLLKLNEQAAAMFELGEDPEVSTGLGVMNELVVPCIPLLLVHDAERDLLAVEDMRNRWCSYLGQEMEANLQEKLTDFLPKLLDCSTEIKSFHDPPKVPSCSALELFERFNRIMSIMGRVPSEGR